MNDSVESVNWLSVELAERDPAWEKNFLAALPKAQVKLISPEPMEGPDHWPYLMVEMDGEVGDQAEPGGNADGAEPLLNILGWLSTRGIGLVVNAQKPTPDYVLTYGMIWNFRERGEFFTIDPTRATGVGENPNTGRFDIKNGQQVFAGPPSEAFLPKYVRAVMKQFLMDQGAFAPKVLMVSLDQKQFDLCFSIESLKSPPAHEHANVAEALAWFLPAHYSVSLLSEKVVPGFQAL